jgi:hypothetical protein
MFASCFEQDIENIDDHISAISWLRDIFLVEKVKNTYRIAEHETVDAIFLDKLDSFYSPSIIARIKEYISEVDRAFY